VKKGDSTCYKYYYFNTSNLFFLACYPINIKTNKNASVCIKWLAWSCLPDFALVALFALFAPFALFTLMVNIYCLHLVCTTLS
jgi:hypothetical protein